MVGKFVQIATVRGNFDQPLVVALCENGTVWFRPVDNDPGVLWICIPPNFEEPAQPAAAGDTPIPPTVGTLWFVKLKGDEVEACLPVTSVQNAVGMMEAVTESPETCFLVAERTKDQAVHLAREWRDKPAGDLDITRHTWRSAHGAWKFSYICDEIPF